MTQRIDIKQNDSILMPNNRVFHDLLDRVGSDGPFQKAIIALCCGILFELAFTSFANTFLFYQGPYLCQSGVPNCQEYVCQLPADERSTYISSGTTFMVDRFGDYRCEVGGELVVAQTVIFSGGIAGILLAILLKSLISYRTTMMGCIFITLLCLLVTILSYSLEVVTAALFLIYGARCVLNQMCYVYLSEMVGEQLRVRGIMLIIFTFALGTATQGVLFWLIQPWWLTLICVQIAPYLVIFLAGFRFFEKAPLQHVQDGQTEGLAHSLQRIADRNGHSFDITSQQLRQVNEEFRQNQTQAHQEQVSILDLFRYESLRVPSLLSLGMHFFLAYQFNCTQLALKDYELNIYLNGSVIGSSEVVGTMLALFIVHRFPRIKAIIACQVASVVVAILLLCMASCSNGHQCSQGTKIAQTIGILTYRFFVSVTYSFFYPLQVEFFPSQVRALGLLATAITMRLGVVVIAPIQAWLEAANASIFITFVVSSAGMILFTAGFPETFGVPPPEMIKELHLKQIEMRFSIHKMPQGHDLCLIIYRIERTPRHEC